MKKLARWTLTPFLITALLFLLRCDKQVKGPPEDPLPETTITWVGNTTFNYIQSANSVVGMNFFKVFKVGDKDGKVDLDATITDLDDNFLDQAAAQVDVKAGEEYKIHLQVSLESGVHMDSPTTCFTVFFDSPSAPYSQFFHVNSYLSEQEIYCFDPTAIASITVSLLN